MLQGVKSYLGRCFVMKDLGKAAYILGIKIYRDRSRRLIDLCQSAYIKKILKRFHMENSKRGSIPMQEKLRLSKLQGASSPAELQCMQNVPYALAIGSIMYAVRCDLHWTIVKNILKYLRNTKDMFLVYRGDLKRELRVSCYTDAGYLTDADDLKSQTGYVFILNGEAAAGSSSQVDFKSEEVDLFADAAFVSTPTSVAAPGSQVNSSLYFVDLVLNSPAVDFFDKSSSESVREPCQYNYMFVVEAKKVDLTDVGIVDCLSAGTEERTKRGLTKLSLNIGRAMGAGSGLGKSTGYSTSTTTDMDDFFSSLSFQK
ncbi:retrotransposon protein, putative, ty1-copia subclass [Tanacetum coccineum]